MGYSVGQVAKFADVTVRALHHYDEIGLLSPSGRSPAGYRRYDDADLERLQSLLFYRELGFPLEEIAAILGDPDVDATAHLRRQRELLLHRIGRLQDMVAAVEFAMEARQVGIRLTPEERFEVFGDHDPARYEDEVRERWGDTDAYKESARRTKSYTKEDWLVIKGQAASLNQRLALAMTSGVPADDPQVLDLAEEHRQQIIRWYYDCTYEIHRGLAEMYVADPRFTATIDADGPGLAAYLRAAILANADRAEG
ncbi:MerR family transcriptional regulator [Longispora sp. K20-0274]|uniref:MerR family transcriptional regulator n=1 Tax=Longispora sp. K20-0274 TaxID=3088255 RepID=UPI00399C366C